MCQTTQSPMLPESRAVNVAVTQVFTDSFWPLDTGFGKKARLAGMKPTPPAVTQLQASRPAIRRLQFRAEARTHFERPAGRRAERGKTAPVWPCEALCQVNGGGAARGATKALLRPLSRPCGGSRGLPPEHAFTPKPRVNPPVGSIAGERTGAFVAPVLSQLPAVRAVAGF